MRQPEAGARRLRADGGGASVPGLGSEGEPTGDSGSAGGSGARGELEDQGDHEPGPASERGLAAGSEDRLPPGQHVQGSMPVLHYGPVPAFNPRTWDLRVYGATESGQEHRWTWEDFDALPRSEIIADFHCVTKFTVLGITWSGVAAAEILRLAPPAATATHVMIWADYGYGANLPMEVFGATDTMLATHREARKFSPEQGFPVRLVVPCRYGWKNVKWIRAIEYLVADKRGFWEERGYHNNADPWLEQRYSYQELPGEGPAI